MKAVVLSMFLLFMFCGDSGTGPNKPGGEDDGKGEPSGSHELIGRWNHMNGSFWDFKASGSVTALINGAPLSYSSFRTENGRLYLGNSTSYTYTLNGNSLYINYGPGALTFTKQGGNQGGDGGGNGGGGDGNGSLVLGENEAWAEPAGSSKTWVRRGLMFRLTGDAVQLYSFNNGTTWLGTIIGDWSVDDDRLTIVDEDGVQVASNTYSITGNQFKFGTATYAKTTGVAWMDRNDERSWLINGPNEAWVGDVVLDRRRHGFILRSDGTYTGIRDDDNDRWWTHGSGTWSIEGDNLHLDGAGGESSFRGNRPYILSNGTSLRFGTTVLTRWNNVTIFL